MSNTVKITVLIEDSVHTGGFKAELGLSCHIQAGDRSVLFDTGQGALVADNAARLGIDLSKLDAIVLSHGHYDHTGGLAGVLMIAPRAKVFMHPAAMEGKYVREPDKSSRRIAMPEPVARSLEPLGGRLLATRESAEPIPGFFTTGEIPRTVPFETPEASLFADAGLKTPDLVPDDQALFFESSEGTVVILGCAHSGVINTLEHVAALTGGKPVCALMGGMHLLRADAARVKGTIEALRGLNLKILAPAHCTGLLATALLWSVFPGQSRACSIGSVFSFDLP